MDLGQPYWPALGNFCSNNALPSILASEEVKDEPVKNPYAVKPEDDKALAVKGTELPKIYVYECKGPVLKLFLRRANGEHIV